jgi:O-antigen/teichoic acid export membrane protein
VYINAQQMRAKVRFAGLSALVSVALNLALLPTLGLMGAVIASVMSESLLLLLTVFGLRRHVRAVTPGLALRPMAIRRQIGLELARGTDRSDLPAQ